mgnify:CR=1 FL=1
MTGPPRAVPSRPGRGRRAAQPEGMYQPPPLVGSDARGVIVAFHGEDGRDWTYPFSRLPCPGLHTDLAAAFAIRTGPTGGLRTKSSADKAWAGVLRFLNFLGGLPHPPQSVGELRPRHLDRFRLFRLTTVTDQGVTGEVAEVRRLLKNVRPVEKLAAELADHLRQPGHLTGHCGAQGQPGYSDREFAALMAAARTDVVAIRDRIRAGERLMATFTATPQSLSDPDRDLAALLVTMDRDGTIPHVAGTRCNFRDSIGEVTLARHLFLSDADLAPLIILGVGLSGRNGETVKELPAEHRVLDDRVMAVNLTKRRRGKALGRETVHWDTGDGLSRQLHTPGGFYLLLHQLTARGRRFAGTGRVWSIWSVANTRNPTTTAVKVQGLGHIDPFAIRIGRDVHLGAWSARHGLTNDDGNPLGISMNRLKTTVEVRTAQAVGGHLPSARHTNTMDVSFLHYLRSDPRIQDWAERILTTAIDDAETSARAFGPRILDTAGQRLLATNPDAAALAFDTTGDVLIDAATGGLDTLASACLDIDHHPLTDTRCTASFATCLRCPNALVTERHLPRLVSLVDEVQHALDTMSVEDWSARHAITWLIITRLILPRFTAEQRSAARAISAPLILDLLDGPKETT